MNSEYYFFHFYWILINSECVCSLCCALMLYVPLFFALLIFICNYSSLLGSSSICFWSRLSAFDASLFCGITYSLFLIFDVSFAIRKILLFDAYGLISIYALLTMDQLSQVQPIHALKLPFNSVHASLIVSIIAFYETN